MTLNQLRSLKNNSATLFKQDFCIDEIVIRLN